MPKSAFRHLSTKKAPVSVEPRDYRNSQELSDGKR
jgi:hypothetical protein